ncbi:MAG: MFS transporter [Elusimicrobia bacterium]|nr:MFS transporter [Elusimicrobiota bacterium]
MTESSSRSFSELSAPVRHVPGRTGEGLHPQAKYVLCLLFAVNLVNYIDRQVLYALLPLVKAEFGASDAMLGALASAFMIVYMCAAPPIGYLADRTRRVFWIAFGLVFWSVATVFSGLSRSYAQLFAARSAVGIGESCYGGVAPSFVAEHFPKERRGGVLAIFSMAIPVGSALGYVLGGWLGQAFGWRSAFFVVGLPGLLLAALAWRLKDPQGPREDRPRKAPTLPEYAALYRNRSYLASTLAMAAMTFSLGGLAVWMPTFFHRAWGMDVARAGTVFGAVTVAGGLLGSLLGGWLGDRLLKVTGKAYFLVSGAGLMLALPAGVLAVNAGSLELALAAVFLTELLAFLNMGPLNGVIVSVTPQAVRSMAFAANIFVIHALGDALSPAIIGRISDLAGLRAGLLFAMLFLGISGAICFWGARHVEKDSLEAGND